MAERAHTGLARYESETSRAIADQLSPPHDSVHGRKKKVAPRGGPVKILKFEVSRAEETKTETNNYKCAGYVVSR